MKAKESTASVNIQPLKKGSCPTLSGKAQLEYVVGQGEAGELYLKVSASDGGGHFDKSYVPWSKVLEALQSVNPVTSIPLRLVYRGKSVNSSGFLLAVLLKEGVIERLPDRSKQYRLAADAEDFPQRILSSNGEPAKKTGGTRAKKSTAPSPETVPPKAKKASRKAASA